MQRSLLLVGLALALVPAASWAAPFKFTPVSFQQWLNANPDRWQEGRQVTFSNLSGCYSGRSYPESFSCSQGFARISDPMGTRVCRLMEVSWRGVDLNEEKRFGSTYNMFRNPPGASFRQGECRWQ
jgi:hypothetical protein